MTNDIVGASTPVWFSDANTMEWLLTRYKLSPSITEIEDIKDGDGHSFYMYNLCQSIRQL